MFIARHPRGSYIPDSTLISVSGSGDTGKKNKSLEPSSICKSPLQLVLSSMHFTLQATRRTPHGALCLVQAMSAWSVKTGHAPSRHCGERVYGHTTTAMHKVSTPPGHNSAVRHAPCVHVFLVLMLVKISLCCVVNSSCLMKHGAGTSGYNHS